MAYRLATCGGRDCSKCDGMGWWSLTGGKCPACMGYGCVTAFGAACSKHDFYLSPPWFEIKRLAIDPVI
jgi:hypothetical protein